MAEIKLTQSQQAVVEDRGGALLVSAVETIPKRPI